MKKVASQIPQVAVIQGLGFKEKEKRITSVSHFNPANAHRAVKKLKPN